MSRHIEHRISTHRSRLRVSAPRPRPATFKAAPSGLDGHAQALSASGDGDVQVMLMDERQIMSEAAAHDGAAAPYHPVWSPPTAQGVRLLLWRAGPAPAPAPSLSP